MTHYVGIQAGRCARRSGITEPETGQQPMKAMPVYNYNRTTSQVETPHGELTREDARLVSEVKRQIKGTGEVLWVDYRGPDWSVLVDTEYAALKSYHAYRGAVSIEKAGGVMGGWLIVKRYDNPGTPK